MTENVRSADAEATGNVSTTTKHASKSGNASGISHKRWKISEAVSVHCVENMFLATSHLADSRFLCNSIVQK